MKRIFVKCHATDCYHHSHTDKSCCISDDTFIDIGHKGNCIDYTPMTEEDLNEIGVWKAARKKRVSKK
jgi:hypothetical protein